MGRAEINYCVYLTVTGSAIISPRSFPHQPSLLSALPSYSLRSGHNTSSALRLGAGEGIFQALDCGMHKKWGRTFLGCFNNKAVFDVSATANSFINSEVRLSEFANASLEAGILDRKAEGNLTHLSSEFNIAATLT